MKNDKQQPEKVSTDDKGFYNGLRVFDDKDNILKNWSGLATKALCTYDDNPGYEEWNVTNTPDNDRNNGYRVRDCYLSISDTAPLSNETKVVESVTLIQEENKQCSHESLERITTTDGKYYEICHHCSLSFPKHPIIQDESAGRFLLKNRLNDICVSGLAAEPKIFASEAMRMYASQFKNIDAVKVITDRIEKLENNLAFRTHGWLGNKLKYQLQEAKDILKLIQP